MRCASLREIDAADGQFLTELLSRLGQSLEIERVKSGGLFLFGDQGLISLFCLEKTSF